MVRILQNQVQGIQPFPGAGQVQPQSSPDPFPIDPPPQRQSSGPSPSMAGSVASSFTGGGTGAAAGGSSAAGGGSGTLAAAANPWTALAAVILANEKSARNVGARDKDLGDHAIDLLSGKVLEQDVEKRWVPKLGSFGESSGISGDLKFGANLATGDFSNAFDEFDETIIGKALSGIGSLF